MSEAKIENNEIVIRIPISAINNASEYAWEHYYGENSLYVEDTKEFAKEIMYALNNEGTSRDGNTLVTRMLDEAVINATEGGAFGINDKERPI